MEFPELISIEEIVRKYGLYCTYKPGRGGAPPLVLPLDDEGQRAAVLLQPHGVRHRTVAPPVPSPYSYTTRHKGYRNNGYIRKFNKDEWKYADRWMSH